MAGISEIIAALVLLTGMGVEQNASTASVSDVYRYAPDGANYSFFLDTKAVLEPTMNKAESLLKSPVINDLLGEARVSEANQGIAMMRMMAKSTLGMDPISDLHWVSAWLKFESKDGPNVLVAAKGNWPNNFFQTLSARIGGTVERSNGKDILRGPRGKMALAMAGNDIILFGTAAWIEPRLSMSWRPAKIEPAVKGLFKNKPHVVAYSQPSPRSGNVVKRWFSGRAAFMRWPLLAHVRFGVALDQRGFNAHWEGTNANNVKRAKLTAEGGISLLRAMQHGTIGFGKLVLAWLPGKSNNPVVATLAKHGDKILELLLGNSGDGDFKAKVKVDKRRKTVTVDAHGKSLSQVLPMGGLPLIAGALWSVSMGKSAPAEAIEKGPIAPLKIAPTPVITK